MIHQATIEFRLQIVADVEAMLQENCIEVKSIIDVEIKKLSECKAIILLNKRISRIIIVFSLGRHISYHIKKFDKDNKYATLTDLKHAIVVEKMLEWPKSS